MRRLSVLALLLAALVVSALPASAAEDNRHWEAHLTPMDGSFPEGTHPQGQATFKLIKDGELAERLECKLSIAAIYDASTIQISVGSGEPDSVVMYLMKTPPGTVKSGRFSGQAVNNPDITGNFELMLPVTSMDDLVSELRDGNVFISVYTGPDTNDSDPVEVLRGQVR